MAPLRFAVLLLALAGCGDDDDDVAPGDGDADADADGDADADADADGDADADADADGDGDGDGDADPVECGAQCRYVRAGGAGAGASWDDALPALPDALGRGLVYFVAAGDYPGEVHLDDAPDGQSIRIVRATLADHGTEAGWQASFADGEAVFGPIAFEEPDYELDGRGALRVVGTLESTVVDISADRVTLRGCDLDGAFAADGGGDQTDGACTVLGISGDDVVAVANDLHDAADDGVVVGGSSRLSFRGNRVHALHGCGTDTGCGPCYNGHSDGFEIYAVSDSEFVGNLAWDIASTSAFFFGNWADELGDGEAEYCTNITLANNILYNPGTGFVAYVEDAVGVHLYHNVFWGHRDGRYGGLSIGEHVRDLEMWNNVILSINYDHIGGSYDAAEHRGDHNLFGADIDQYPLAANDLVALDPGFTGIPDGDGAEVTDPDPAAFTPVGDSPLREAGYGGDADIVLPATDFFGAARDDTPTIGAIE